MYVYIYEKKSSMNNPRVIAIIYPKELHQFVKKSNEVLQVVSNSVDNEPLGACQDRKDNMNDTYRTYFNRVQTLYTCLHLLSNLFSVQPLTSEMQYWHLYSTSTTL